MTEQIASDGTSWQPSTANYVPRDTAQADEHVLMLPDAVHGVRGVAAVEPMGDEHWVIVTFSVHEPPKGEVTALRWRLGDRMVTIPVEIGPEGALPASESAPPEAGEPEPSEIKDENSDE